MSIPEFQGELDLNLPEPTTDQRTIIDTLIDYKREADQNRSGGLNPRDAKWQENLDLYWNRVDFSEKADWQSKNVMPEVPAYVDRFAASLKDAMVSTPNGFYTVTDPYDTNHDIEPGIKQMTDVWLSTIGRNQIGQPQDFSSVFEEQTKLGALMAMSGVVMWKDDVPGGRVAFETVDPRMVWLDHTYRNLYRIRRTEIDMIDLARMTKDKSKRGKPLYNLDEIERLVGTRALDSKVAQERRDLTGSGEDVLSKRKPVLLDEYLASVVDDRGRVLMDKQVVILADDEYLLRGPEKNPFWHGQDWMVYTPLMPVPMSPYGRSYMEDFGNLAKVFTDLTNLILDATYMASMKAYVMVPSMLMDPSQVNTGVYPNKMFLLEEGYSAEDFAKDLALGSIDPTSINMWTNMKSELSDASGMNEIGLGQLPDKTHIAATAVAGAQQSSSAILRSVAQTIETRFLDPLLDLVWKTGLQHADENDIRMTTAVGPDMYRALLSQRKELIKKPLTFQARGISELIQRQQQLSSILNIMQVVAQNPMLMQAFMQRVDINKLVTLLFRLSNVDVGKMEPSARDILIQSVTDPLANTAAQAEAMGGTPSPAAVSEMGTVANAMGVAKQ